MSETTTIDDIFAKLTDFADLKVAKLRFDELYEQRRQEETEKVRQAAERIDHTLVANGHGKPARRGRTRKNHDPS